MERKWGHVESWNASKYGVKGASASEQNGGCWYPSFGFRFAFIFHRQYALLVLLISLLSIWCRDIEVHVHHRWPIYLGGLRL